MKYHKNSRRNTLKSPTLAGAWPWSLMKFLERTFRERKLWFERWSLNESFNVLILLKYFSSPKINLHVFIGTLGEFINSPLNWLSPTPLNQVQNDSSPSMNHGGLAPHDMHLWVGSEMYIQGLDLRRTSTGLGWTHVAWTPFVGHPFWAVPWSP